MGHEIIAYADEPGYMEAPSGTTINYMTPGADVTVEELTLENAAQRIRVPGQANPYASVFHNFEGALSVTGTVTAGNLDWLSYVTAKTSSPYEFQIGEASSSRWYLGTDPRAGVAEREAMGVIFPQASLSVEQDGEVTFDLTGVYGDESYNTTLTQGSAIQPTGDPLVYHGGALAIPSATTLQLVQSATLTLNSQARLLHGLNRHPEGAQMGGHESEIEFERIETVSDDVSSLAYGDSGASAPAKSPTSAAGELTFADGSGSNVITATLGDIVPDSYSWNNAGNVNEDMMENGTFHVNAPSITA